MLEQISASVAGATAGGFWGLQQSREQRDWNERMFMQRHQMEVDDLIRAGLNPVLSAGGNPGQPNSYQIAQSPDFSGALNSGAQIAKASEEVENLRVQNDVLKAQKKNVDEDTRLKEIAGDKAAADFHKTMLESFNVPLTGEQIASSTMVNQAEVALKSALQSQSFAQVGLIIQNMHKAGVETETLREQLKRWRTEGEIDASTYGKVLRFIDRALPFVNTLKR